MERSISSVQGIEQITFFPIRHLSSAASFHLRRLLDKKRPKCILIEGPSDGNELLSNMVQKGVKPPIAILAYTQELPIDTILYPFADYSPEYQAILWGMTHQAEVAFIDLPTSVSLSFHCYQRNHEESARKTEEDNESAEEILDEKEDRYHSNDTEKKEANMEESKSSYSIYTDIADVTGEINYDAYWERNFEHNLNEGAYEEALRVHSASIRNILEPEERLTMPSENAHDRVRESFMLRQIADSLERFQPEEIVVITGAYHSQTLISDTMPLTDKEMELLPRRESKLTLMPYSYYKLSSYSGYGAGNIAPAYYEMMWKHMCKGELDKLPMTYMTTIGRHIRESGGYCSTANVIEAVRLSMSLAGLKNGSLPTLSDLHDAAVACMGHGEQSEASVAFAAADIGTAFGELPEGISQTPIQDDLNRNLRRLKLESYRNTVAQELTLDLRENRRVQSKELAFMDLERSTFLHRLAFIGITFAKQQRLNQDAATWKEQWIFAWSPEVEIQVVESVLKGETIELASAFQLMERLQKCQDIDEAAVLIKEAYICKLTSSLDRAIQVLQGLTVDSGNFVKTTEAALVLSDLIQYGSIRQVDINPLMPLLKQIFLRACFLLLDASGCDDKEAHQVAKGMGTMHLISQENSEVINDDQWVKVLSLLSGRDDKNALLSGLAFSILLERNLVAEEVCSAEVSRRLSPGVPADVGAGWFEGLSMRNRYALISRAELFRELDSYVQELDEEEFKRSVVFLRRAFGGFEPREKNSVAELLADLWGLNTAEISMLLQAPLEQEELDALEELGDFDFDL